MTSMLDLMPAPGLIFNEWNKHGTCSGLAARAYFETIRKARAAVKIPEEYLQLSDTKTVAPAEIEDAFVKVNPGLSTPAMAVTCNRTRLSEVRICMGKDLQFRDCDDIDRRSCRRDQVIDAADTRRLAAAPHGACRVDPDPCASSAPDDAAHRREERCTASGIRPFAGITL